MKLIADSGSTKTSWVLLDQHIAAKHDTMGFNPYYMGADIINKILTEELPEAISGAEVDEIFYYGSGCSTSAIKSLGSQRATAVVLLPQHGRAPPITRAANERETTERIRRLSRRLQHSGATTIDVAMR